MHIIAESTEALCHSVYHWLGASAPYAALSEELEGHYTVRISWYLGKDSAAAAEEVLVPVSKLAGSGGELFEEATKCARAADGVGAAGSAAAAAAAVAHAAAHAAAAK